MFDMFMNVTAKNVYVMLHTILEVMFFLQFLDQLTNIRKRLVTKALHTICSPPPLPAYSIVSIFYGPMDKKSLVSFVFI
jgi:hypothetical protein